MLCQDGFWCRLWKPLGNLESKMSYYLLGTVADYECSQGGWGQVGHSINGKTIALSALSHIAHYNPINR